jgi:hypothetical protein
MLIRILLLGSGKLRNGPAGSAPPPVTMDTTEESITMPRRNRPSLCPGTALLSRAVVAISVLTLAAVLAGCSGYSGPPDIELAREGIAPEYHITYSGEDGKTVLELLREHVDAVVTEGSGDELLVTAINGIEGGVEGRYWLYYVNDQPGLISASRMPTVAGDSIEWLFVR